MIRPTDEPKPADYTTRTAFFIITLLLVGASVMKKFPEFRRYFRYIGK